MEMMAMPEDSLMVMVTTNSTPTLEEMVVKMRVRVVPMPLAMVESAMVKMINSDLKVILDTCQQIM
jgi:hypothetical protein